VLNIFERGCQILRRKKSSKKILLFEKKMNRWKDEEAQKYVSKYSENWGKDLALRVYTSRLIGSDSK